jgi:hypothetical protein
MVLYPLHVEFDSLGVAHVAGDSSVGTSVAIGIRFGRSSARLLGFDRNPSVGAHKSVGRVN